MHGGDINKENKVGDIFLVISLCNNLNENLTKYLMEHDSDINKRNKFNIYFFNYSM